MAYSQRQGQAAAVTAGRRRSCRISCAAARPARFAPTVLAESPYPTDRHFLCDRPGLRPSTGPRSPEHGAQSSLANFDLDKVDCLADVDILHVWRNPMRRIDSDDDFAMLIGPDTAARVLEIGVLDIDGDDPVAIHAMPLRPKFDRFLRGGG